MRKYLERVMMEKKKLDKNRAKLRDFVYSNTCPASPAHRGLLLRQLDAMDEYSRILQERVELEGS
jgi:hypothetical protein